jgi:hypothetical protein
MTIKCSLNMTDVISRTTLWKLMYEVFICLYRRCFFHYVLHFYYRDHLFEKIVMN